MNCSDNLDLFREIMGGLERMSKPNPAVLIIAYRRHENLKKLLRLCIENKIERVYVSVDAPANFDAEENVSECLKVIKDFQLRSQIKLFTKVASSNLGCSLSVLTACDWIFSREEFVIIIEDDCLPSNDFFTFVNDGFEEMIKNPSIGMVGGSQFAPSQITGDTWSLSDYPLIWGWATTRNQWKQISESYFGLASDSISSIFSTHHEDVYWRSGMKRALTGIVDAWDTPLVYVFKKLGLKALLPGGNLVVNVGNDSAATHTTSFSSLLNRRVTSYRSSAQQPELNIQLNTWQQKKLYGISFRHIFSTRITQLRDFVSTHKESQMPLLDRWSAFQARSEL